MAAGALSVRVTVTVLVIPPPVMVIVPLLVPTVAVAVSTLTAHGAVVGSGCGTDRQPADGFAHTPGPVGRNRQRLTGRVRGSLSGGEGEAGRAHRQRGCRRAKSKGDS